MQASRRHQGSALILATVVAMLLMLMVAGLWNTTLTRSRSEAFLSNHLVRFDAAEAGLARVKLMVKRHSALSANENWLAYWAGTKSDSPFARNAPGCMRPVQGAGPMSWGTGYPHFDIPAGTEAQASPPLDVVRVRAFVLEPPQSTSDSYQKWYLVVVRAEMNGNDRSIATLVRPRDFFSKFARFVSSRLTVSASNVTYDGYLHSNNDLDVTGWNNTFRRLATARTSVTCNGAPFSSINHNNADFREGYAENQPWITPPGLGDLLELGTRLPGGSAEEPAYAGSIAYDWRNSEFQWKCDCEEVGFTPDANDKIETTIVFHGTTMDVTTTVRQVGTNGHATGASKEFAETHVAIPHNQCIFVNGNCKVKGDMASRCTLLCTKSIICNGPLRYVNELDEPQYSLYEDGDVATYNEQRQEWSPADAGQWASPPDDGLLVYRETTNWTQPQDANGAPYDPCLGLVAVNHIYSDPRAPDGSKQYNAERHAYFLTLGEFGQGDPPPMVKEACTHVLDTELLAQNIGDFDGDGITDSDDWNAYEWAHGRESMWYKGLRSYPSSSTSNNSVIIGGLASTTGCLIYGFRYSIIKYDTRLLNHPPPHFPSVPTPTYRNWHEVETMVVDPVAGTYELQNHDVSSLTVNRSGTAWQ